MKKTIKAWAIYGYRGQLLWGTIQPLKKHAIKRLVVAYGGEKLTEKQIIDYGYRIRRITITLGD